MFFNKPISIGIKLHHRYRVNYSLFPVSLVCFFTWYDNIITAGVVSQSYSARNRNKLIVPRADIIKHRHGNEEPM